MVTSLNFFSLETISTQSLLRNRYFLPVPSKMWILHRIPLIPLIFVGIILTSQTSSATIPDGLELGRDDSYGDLPAAVVSKAGKDGREGKKGYLNYGS